MKNFITLLVLTAFTITTAMATSTPSVEIENKKIFTSADYNFASETFEFETKSEISVVQVYDIEGEIIFQLPVMSNHLKIKKNIFEEGEYQLGFVLEGETTVNFTKVHIN